MKLSNKGRYALQAMFDLAYHNEGKAAQIKDICERQAIPSRFLEQVFQDLKKAGLVKSKRGPRGGYRLGRAAPEIRLGDVVRAIEGPVTLGAPDLEKQAGSSEVLAESLAELAAQMQACLDDVTLADLCARAEQRGLARSPASRYVYAI